jgi:pyruvate dehydrogenase E2 component (dihydrolipoamide acetyltransferase)
VAAAAARRAPGERVVASPLAKSMARNAGIDIAAVGLGSGPNGRIIAKDIEAALASGGLPLASVAADIELDEYRRGVADALTQAKREIPHYYLTVDVDVTALLAMQDSLSSMSTDTAAGISVDALVLKAASVVMRDVPEVNSAWMGSFIRQYENVDINLAVPTEGGLVSPVVHGVQSTGIAELGAKMTSLTEEANAGSLSEAALAPGTFTVVNVGEYGVRQLEAIVRPPQACALSIGSIDKRVVPSTDSAGTTTFDAASIMSVTLSCDHRVVDGAVGAQWLKRFKEVVENPVSIVM